MDFVDFVERHVATIEPLEKESALAYWEAARTGNEEDFRRYSELIIELEKVYTNKDDFEFISESRNDGALRDEKLKRIADLLYLQYLANQIDHELLSRIVELSSSVENRFNVFRPEVDGRKITTNDVNDALRNERDSEVRRKVWEADKRVALGIVDDLVRLVELRNEAAKGVGFDNFYSMSLTVSEQDETEMVKLFDELDELTREPYEELKARIDAELASIYGIEAEDVMPWHYHDPFLQEAPNIGKVDIDKFYEKSDVVEVAVDFYNGIGMDVTDIIARSDLYEREGKSPHAFCTNIDRHGDVRILANIRNNSTWMDTILHELGHAVYDKNIDCDLPYILRTYPHLCTTEASAMYFGRLAQDPLWMKSALHLNDYEIEAAGPAIRDRMRTRQMIFARWCQTMFRFERELYSDPRQDLNKLWWDIVEKYQLVRRPEGRNEPDWAAKIHIVTSPVYYHNYMLGEMIASQLHHYIATVVLEQDPGSTDIYGRREVGDYLKNVVYKPGALYRWDRHIEVVTGEPLTPRYFVEQFVNV